MSTLFNQASNQVDQMSLGTNRSNPTHLWPKILSIEKNEGYLCK
jgi:hypothetical protein